MSGKIRGFLMRPTVQFAVSTASAVLAWATLAPAKGAGIRVITDFGGLYGILGALAAVLALVGSFSITHALQFAYAALSSRYQGYSELRSRLDSLDQFLRSQNQSDPIVDETRAFIWELGKLRFSDFPIRDWEDRLAAVTKALDLEFDGRPDHLWHEIVGGLHRCEETVSDIGLNCIRQIVASCLLRPVVKMFVYLALLLVAMAALLLVPSLPREVAAAGVVFFTAMTIYLLAEVLAAVHRDFDERMDFVEHSASLEREETKPNRVPGADQ